MTAAADTGFVPLLRRVSLSWGLTVRLAAQHRVLDMESNYAENTRAFILSRDT